MQELRWNSAVQSSFCTKNHCKKKWSTSRYCKTLDIYQFYYPYQISIWWNESWNLRQLHSCPLQQTAKLFLKVFISFISFNLYEQSIRISNFCNKSLFVYFVSKYWQDKGFKLRPKYIKNANIADHIKNSKTLCYTLDWWHWFLCFLKLVVRMSFIFIKSQVCASKP